MSAVLHIEPIDYKTAAEYVDEHHRHHSRPVGHKYSISCWDDDRLCGVAMVGRPVADTLTMDIPSKSIAFAQTVRKTPVLCCMQTRGGRQRR